MPHGFGILKCPNKNEYVGNFINGEPNGNGKIIFENKNKYVGDFF